MAIEINHATNDIAIAGGGAPTLGGAPAGGGGDTINVETLAANKTLTNSDDTIQALDPNGVSRDVILPAEQADLGFIILNTGTATGDFLVIRDDADAVSISAIGAGQAVKIISDGTSWFVLDIGTGMNGTAVTSGYNNQVTGLYSVGFGSDLTVTGTTATAIGYQATASAANTTAVGLNAWARSTSGIAIGDAADTGTSPEVIAIGNDCVVSGVTGQAIVIGKNATAASAGTGAIAIGYNSDVTANACIAIGYLAQATALSAHAIGYSADATASGAQAYGNNANASGVNSSAYGYAANAAHELSVTIGAFGQSQRVAEITNNVSGATTDDAQRGWVGFYGETTSTSATEIFCGGQSNERFTITASSVVGFRGHIAGRDNTTGDCCYFSFDGVIKRDAANNTALVGSVSYSQREDVAGFDVSVAADDVNEALTVTVTAPTTNATRFTGNIEYVEAIF